MQIINFPMGTQECIVDIEGQRGFFQIILSLYENPEMLQSQLYNNRPYISISNNSTAIRAIGLLVKYHLVEEKKKDGSNAKYYRLTKKGQDCAKLLLDLQDLLIQDKHS
jgi:hypothetical protein